MTAPRRPSPAAALEARGQTSRGLLAPAGFGLAIAHLLAFLLLAPPVRGQSIPSPYRYIENGQATSVFAGRMSLSTGSLALGPKSGFVVGGRYAVETGGPVFFEGVLAYLPTKRDVIDPRRQLGDRTIGESDANLLMADARLSLSLTGRRSWRWFAPHLFVGIGVAHDLSGAGEVDRKLEADDVFNFGTAFTAGAGSGARLFLGSRVMLRADASLTLWQLSTPSGFGDPEKRPSDRDDPLYAPEQSEWVGGYGLGVSLAWRF